MKNRNTNKNAIQRGFTLVEIMVVIVILGLLATVVAPNVMGHLFTSREEAARQSVLKINEAVELWKMHNPGRELPTLQDLIEPDERTKEPLLKGYTEPPKDPWGNEFVIGPHPDNERSWMVFSKGENGIDGDEDDITSLNIKDQKKK